MSTKPRRMAWARGLPGVCTSQLRKMNSCGLWAAAMEFIITLMSPALGFFMPAGTPRPLATRRCSWFSTERAPTAT